MAEKNCPVCGAAVFEGKKFCGECGAIIPIEENEKSVVTSMVTEEVTAEKVLTEKPETISPSPVVQPITPVQSTPMPQTTSPVQPPLTSGQQQLNNSAIPLDDLVPSKKSKYAPISTLGYIGITILMFIPLLNIIMLIIWACGGCRKVNKQNYARATIIMALVLLVSGIVIGVKLSSEIEDIFNGSEVSSNISIEDRIKEKVIESALEKTNVSMVFDIVDVEVLEKVGVKEEDIDVFKALKSGDKEALIEQGYTEEEINQVFDLLNGGIGDISSIVNNEW